jgi:hypothetical protein
MPPHSATGVPADGADPGLGSVLTAGQVNHFNTFGFLRLRGFFADEFERLAAGFDEAFASESPTLMNPANPYHQADDPRYEEKLREMVPYFIERSDKLSWLRTDPRVLEIAASLLGPDFEYAESDGNLFNCELYWHIDAYAAPITQHHIKLYFYLDPLNAESGALRVIPGTNVYTETYAQGLYRDLMADPGKVSEIYGVEINEIPSWTIDSEPGDLIIGDYRTLHGSFNGGVGRRLFTVNFREIVPANDA